MIEPVSTDASDVAGILRTISACSKQRLDAIRLERIDETDVGVVAASVTC